MGFGQEYQKHGIDSFYTKIGEDYYNPHEKDIKTLITAIYEPNLTYLDLGAGDGIVSQALIEAGCLNVEGCEPYLFDLYKKRTNKNCLKLTFEDISKGLLTKKYDVIICSYAMHLLDESFLPNLLYYLSQSANQLIILSPHKRPKIESYWSLSNTEVLNKTKMKTYTKNTF